MVSLQRLPHHHPATPRRVACASAWRATPLACGARTSPPRAPRRTPRVGTAPLLLAPTPSTRARLPAPRAGRKLESESLPPPDLAAIEAVVSRADGAGLTAGDAARATGLPLARAEAALAALAADTAGSLNVSELGDVVYVVPADARTRLRAASALLRLRPALEAALAGVNYAARAAFGATLILSVALVAAALVAASTAASGDDRDRGRSRPLPVSFYVSPADLLLWFDPYAYRRARTSVGQTGRGQGGKKIGFLESVFDVVFGGPDPNADYDATRWTAVGRAIEAAGGVVTAAQLAPYLDEGSSGRSDDDESFIVPALVRFQGHADVDEAGRLLYYFPSLSTTTATGGWLGSGAPARRPPPPPTLEAPVPFTRASPGQRFAVLALAVVNFAGVGALGSALADPTASAALALNGFGFIRAFFPFLQAYSAAFFILPALRWLWLRRVNDAIANRNEARSAAAAALAAPSRAAASALAAAAAAAARGDGARVVREADVVFDSAATDLADAELDAFDRKLRGVRDACGGGGKAAPGKAAPDASYDSWLGR